MWILVNIWGLCDQNAYNIDAQVGQLPMYTKHLNIAITNHPLRHKVYVERLEDFSDRWEKARNH